MSVTVESMAAHMSEWHETSVAGFTLNELIAEHLLLHQYEHGIPSKDDLHDLDHQGSATPDQGKGEPR